MNNRSTLSMLLDAHKLTEKLHIPIPPRADTPKNNEESKESDIIASLAQKLLPCIELIRALLSSEIFKNGSPSALGPLDENSLQLLAAEEDGTPMDDLPEFSGTTDILSMGVEDFVLINRTTGKQVMHIRISRKDLNNVGSTIEVVQYSALNPAVNKESLGFEEPRLLSPPFSPRSPLTDEEMYIVDQPKQRRDSDTDIIPIFRTESDEMLAAQMSPIDRRNFDDSSFSSRDRIISNDSGSALILENPLKLSPPDAPPYRSKLSRLRAVTEDSPVSPPAKGRIATNSTTRARSSSGGLTISCRKPGTEQWCVAKQFVICERAPAPAPVTPKTPSKKGTTTPRKKSILIPTAQLQVASEMKQLQYHKNIKDELSEYIQNHLKQRSKLLGAEEGEHPPTIDIPMYTLNPHTSFTLTPTPIKTVEARVSPRLQQGGSSSDNLIGSAMASPSTHLRHFSFDSNGNAVANGAQNNSGTPISRSFRSRSVTSDAEGAQQVHFTLQNPATMHALSAKSNSTAHTRTNSEILNEGIAEESEEVASPYVTYSRTASEAEEHSSDSGSDASTEADYYNNLHQNDTSGSDPDNSGALQRVSPRQRHSGVEIRTHRPSFYNRLFGRKSTTSAMVSANATAAGDGAAPIASAAMKNKHKFFTRIRSLDYRPASRTNGIRDPKKKISPKHATERTANLTKGELLKRVPSEDNIVERHSVTNLDTGDVIDSVHALKSRGKVSVSMVLPVKEAAPMSDSRPGENSARFEVSEGNAEVSGNIQFGTIPITPRMLYGGQKQI